MKTHGIGQGTANVVVNLLHEERRVIAKISIQHGCSFGAAVRSLVLDGLRSGAPDLAQQFQHARQIRRAAQLEERGISV